MRNAARGVALGWLLALAAATASPAASPAPPDSEEFFETRIRPVLVESCFRCHGGKETEQGLRVDSRPALLAGGKRGAAIVPGNADRSLLVQAVRRTHDELQMPPDAALPESVVADLASWVNAGAPWPRYESDGGDPAFQIGSHWSFQPLKKVAPPPHPSGWSENPIDCLIAAEWRKRDLNAVASADRRTLLRRAWFDMIGLPPTPDETAAFLADEAPDAWERLVDRLLASPQYGERWGRHWMDVVRYADTAGDNADYPVPEARLYRDYIIDSYNADKPFDQFMSEQVAGDLLAREGPPEKFAEQTAATGFLALSRRYATAPYEFWHLTLEDTIDTFGQAFLGLTLRCARCHDHKFDPIRSEDYYALYGIFDSTQYPWAGGEEFESKKTHRQHFVPLIAEADAAPREAAFRAQLDARAAEIARREQQPASGTEAERASLQQQLDVLRAEQFQAQRSGLPPDVPAAYAVRERASRNVAVQQRGDPGQPGPVAARGALHYFAPQPLEIPAEESGRRQLAEWLTRPDHPLPARVAVNRIWQHHFGRGIVATPSNFGLRGAAPSHPELLDYLAARFIANGWSVKEMHRLILTSQTWRLSSQDDAENVARDTGNEFYWRRDRQRLDAEAMRDALLSVSGQLDSRRPGAHPFPPIRDWHWTQHNPFKDIYPSPHRSVYLMTQRLQRHPFLAIFDGPDPNTTTEKRAVSTVPPQSLYLLNSPEMKSIAESLGRRLLAAAPDEVRRIELAYGLCYAREPAEEEIVRCEAYLAAYRREAGESAGGELAEREAWTSLARALLAANEFCYLD